MQNDQTYLYLQLLKCKSQRNVLEKSSLIYYLTLFL
jgi:hypothetical protein